MVLSFLKAFYNCILYSLCISPEIATLYMYDYGLVSVQRCFHTERFLVNRTKPAPITQPKKNHIANIFVRLGSDLSIGITTGFSTENAGVSFLT